jgi:hypothetical protein
MEDGVEQETEGKGVECEGGGSPARVVAPQVSRVSKSYLCARHTAGMQV